VETYDKRIYYTMGEVTEMFDVSRSLLRYWESEFDVLKPARNKKGNRLFTPEDVDTVKLIYHLLKEQGLKIAVAKKRVKQDIKSRRNDIELVERLMSIRAELEQINQELREGGLSDMEETELAEIPRLSKPAKRAETPKPAERPEPREPAEMPSPSNPDEEPARRETSAEPKSDFEVIEEEFILENFAEEVREEPKTLFVEQTLF